MGDVGRRVTQLEARTGAPATPRGPVIKHRDGLYSTTEEGERMAWEHLVARYGDPVMLIVLPARESITD